MKVSDLILELQEFLQVYGDLEAVAGRASGLRFGLQMEEAPPADVVGLERIGKPGKAMRCHLRTA